MSDPTHLIVLAAFDRSDDDGLLRPAFDPVTFDNEDQAKRAAELLVGKHTGIVAWSRKADLDLGEYGDPHVIFRHGDVPEME